MPCGEHRKAAVTDRAHRYRARQCAPAGPRRCKLCGSTRFLVVDHWDGDEHNGRRSNLRWLCKSCNNAEGARMIREGRGRRTRQFNRGARHYGEYINAVLEHERGAHDRGGKMIHETPKHLRQEFAEKIWRRRRMRGNPKTKKPRPAVMLVHTPGELKPWAVSALAEDGRYVRIAGPFKTEAEAKAAYRSRRPNPILESLVAGAAAGTAAVVAGKYLANKNPRKVVFYGPVSEAGKVLSALQAKGVLAVAHAEHEGRQVISVQPGDLKAARAAIKGNPRALSYLKAAERAAKRGEFGKTQKLLGKYAKKRGKELRAGNPYVLVKQDGKPVNSAILYLEGDLENLRYHSISDGHSYEFQNTTTRRKVRIAKGKRTPASNPGAEQMFTEFHGRGPAEVLEMQDAIVKAGDYAALGDNPEIWLVPVKGDPAAWPPATITFERSDGVKLATDATGGQLYFIGNGQRLSQSDLRAAGYDTSKRFITLGPAHGISYETQKNFDGFQTTTYAHRLGEETGELPTLIYDTETKRLILSGGAYRIAPLEKDLGASPGIEN